MIAPVTLTGRLVKLAPLAEEQHDALCEAVRDGELWRLWYTNVSSPETMREEIAERLSLWRQGTMLPFAVIDQRDGRIVGMTGYLNADLAVPRVEIGRTWYAQSTHRTGINTEAKLLLFAHAFDTLGCAAVEIRTHFLNQQSRRAIERLGAKLDGVLRNQQRLQNGTIRDACVYSVIASEWPSVRSHLRWQLEKPRGAVGDGDGARC